MNTTGHIKVWDPLVRIFHWVLVGAFLIAYLTEDDWMQLHALAGYVVSGLLVFRLLWGFIGTRHARFADFIFSPRVVLTYLKETFTLKARRYVGHNPAGGAMIVLLLVTLAATSLSGLALYAVGESAGPLAAGLSGLSNSWEGVFNEMHEFLANFTVFLVVVHVGGVIFESLLHRENLITAMWTGDKQAASRDITDQAKSGTTKSGMTTNEAGL